MTIPSGSQKCSESVDVPQLLFAETRTTISQVTLRSTACACRQAILQRLHEAHEGEEDAEISTILKVDKTTVPLKQRDGLRAGRNANLDGDHEWRIAFVNLGLVSHY